MKEDCFFKRLKQYNNNNQMCKGRNPSLSHPFNEIVKKNKIK